MMLARLNISSPIEYLNRSIDHHDADQQTVNIYTDLNFMDQIEIPAHACAQSQTEIPTISCQLSNRALMRWSDFACLEELIKCQILIRRCATLSIKTQYSLETHGPRDLRVSVSLFCSAIYG